MARKKYREGPHSIMTPITWQLTNHTKQRPCCQHQPKISSGFLIKFILLLIMPHAQGCSVEPMISVNSADMCTTTLNEIHSTAVI